MRGLTRLPEGKRRKKLEANFDKFVHAAFNNKILAFDEQAAFLYGEISARRERKGLSVDPVDLMISAIAKYYNASIATLIISTLLTWPTRSAPMSCVLYFCENPQQIAVDMPAVVTEILSTSS